MREAFFYFMTSVSMSELVLLKIVQWLCMKSNYTWSTFVSTSGVEVIKTLKLWLDPNSQLKLNGFSKLGKYLGKYH